MAISAFWNADADDMTVIVSPSPDDRVEYPYQVGLFRSAVSLDRTAHLFEEGVHVLLRWCRQNLPIMSPQVLPKEVEAVFDMRDAGLLR